MLIHKKINKKNQEMETSLIIKQLKEINDGKNGQKGKLDKN
jgi:hypothetical protein